VVTPGLGRRLMLSAVKRRWRLTAVSLPLWFAQKVRLTGVLPRRVRAIPRLRLAHLLNRMSTNYVPAEGVPERQVVLFTGCVTDAWWRDVHWATIAVLSRLGWRVRVPYGQVCCGAIHSRAGRRGQARKLAARNILPLEQFEGSIVIDASRCAQWVKGYGQLLDDRERPVAVAGRAADVAELITPDDVRALDPRPPDGLRRVALHDPTGGAVRARSLLQAAGYELIEGGHVGADAVAVDDPGFELAVSVEPGVPPVYHLMQLLALAARR